MRTNDYFTTQDMQFFGPEAWERVRAKLRTEGHTIVKGYGEYGRNSIDHHYIFLSVNGNLVHTKEKPKGVHISVQKYLGLGKSKRLKIKTGNDKEVVRQAFQYLVGLGYDDRNRNAMMCNGNMTGLLADSDGVIYSIHTLDGFEDKYSAVEELEFDKEVKVTLSNFRPVRKTINLYGAIVYKDVFEQFLKDNEIKSAT